MFQRFCVQVGHHWSNLESSVLIFYEVGHNVSIHTFYDSVIYLSTIFIQLQETFLQKAANGLQEVRLDVNASDLISSNKDRLILWHGCWLELSGRRGLAMGLFIWHSLRTLCHIDTVIPLNNCCACIQNSTTKYTINWVVPSPLASKCITGTARFWRAIADLIPLEHRYPVTTHLWRFSRPKKKALRERLLPR